ncbi:ATPase family AAA domain-containing protein 2-like [Rhynochetos jubatus]
MVVLRGSAARPAGPAACDGSRLRPVFELMDSSSEFVSLEPPVLGSRRVWARCGAALAAARAAGCRGTGRVGEAENLNMCSREEEGMQGGAKEMADNKVLSEESEDREDEANGRNRYDFRERKAVERSRASLKKPKQRKTPYSRQSPPVRQRASSSSRQSQGPCCRRSKRSLPPNLQTDDLQGIHKDRTQVGASLAGADGTDGLVRFDSVGGLSEHISALKEMVVFPLLYPEFFEGFKIQPPRGCIFYGPPGTGKTLVAQALANECRQGDRKIAFFMRSGADCLSKWVGESEQQLRSLFDQAYQMRPSIIFLDEIDGLAPERSSKQDQVYSSIVTTLLTLMDGLNGRGEVVVIGATNRLDSIDPALRRPGRFDREFLFSLPNREARKEIFKIHTRDWSPQPLDSFLDELAAKCVGYCGADIKSLCAEAALCALRRHYPQIYQSTEKLQLNMASIKITAQDFVTAMQKIVPASQRVVSSPGRPLTPMLKPLLGNTLARILRALQRAFPHAELALRNREQALCPVQGGSWE